ncbi:MAG: hypothetical protein OXR03_30070, partial [Rhodospirillaceae bacterium]|nr:hypothetical protein [Rhodospirillaceae bacterium]
LQTIASAGSVPRAIILPVFGFGQRSITLDSGTPKTWRAILLLAILSSLFNGISQPAVLELGKSGPSDALLIIQFVIGDIVGTIAVFA